MAWPLGLACLLLASWGQAVPMSMHRTAGGPVKRVSLAQAGAAGLGGLGSVGANVLDTVDTVRQKTDAAKNKAKEQLDEVQQQAEEALKSAKDLADQAKQATGDAKKTLERQAKEAKKRAGEFADTAKKLALIVAQTTNEVAFDQATLDQATHDLNQAKSAGAAQPQSGPAMDAASEISWKLSATNLASSVGGMLVGETNLEALMEPFRKELVEKGVTDVAVEVLTELGSKITEQMSKTSETHNLFQKQLRDPSVESIAAAVTSMAQYSAGKEDAKKFVENKIEQIRQNQLPHAVVPVAERKKSLQSIEKDLADVVGFRRSAEQQINEYRTLLVQELPSKMQESQKLAMSKLIELSVDTSSSVTTLMSLLNQGFQSDDSNALATLELEATHIRTNVALVQEEIDTIAKDAGNTIERPAL